MHTWYIEERRSIGEHLIAQGHRCWYQSWMRHWWQLAFHWSLENVGL